MKRDIRTSQPMLTVYALKRKSVDPVGGSKNMNMNLFAAVNPDVVIQLLT